MAPAPTGVLQRQCACGLRTGGTTCPECRKKETLHRRPVRSLRRSGAHEDPSFVPRPPGRFRSHEDLSFGPRPSSGTHDFSRVRPSSRPGRTRGARIEIGLPGDRHEREAERVADQVMRMSEAGAAGPAAREEAWGSREAARVADQVLCMSAPGGARPAARKEDRRRGAALQRSRAGPGAPEPMRAPPAEAAARAVEGRGSPLSPEVRSFFEPRFGRDFSDVRVHTDGRAASAAEGIQARAYTLGSKIAFAPGQFAPWSPGGRRLLAHELAHVVQQSGAPPGPIRRNVAANSSCPASVAGAPADPLDALRTADAEAQRMTLGASNVLFLESVTFRDPTFGPSAVSTAYRRRFGPPAPASGDRFRNRFSGQLSDTEDEALAGEMQSLSDRFRGLHDFLGGAIRYRCPGTARITVGGCTDRCGADEMAWTCTPQDARTIAICEEFWGLSGPQRAGVLVHEAVHMRLNFAQHGSGNARQRGRNPECYTSLILDLYRPQGGPAAEQIQFDPADPQCPPL